jgi:TatD DNase family protein
MRSLPHPVAWDAHVHLPAYPDPDAAAKTAVQSGIGLLSVTVSTSEAIKNIELREKNPEVVRCFIGLHPSEAGSSSGDLAGLSSLWERADGIGEIGLDPKYSPAGPGSPQMGLFEGQVAIAERLHKPLQVHSRGAESACLEVLQVHSLAAVLMHWFEGEETLEMVLSRPKTFISFGPALLYSKKLRRLAKRCPPDVVLAESDGPVAFAALGGAAGPGLVPSVAFKLAEVWGSGFEEALQILSANLSAYMGG